MFFARERSLDMPWRMAVARLSDLAVGGGLDEVSLGAYQQGLAGLASGRIPGDAVSGRQLVDVLLLDPAERGDTVTAGLRWQAADATAGLFPVMDASITLTADGKDGTRLKLAGAYRVPASHASVLDPAAVQRVVTATVRVLLADLAAALARPLPAADLRGIRAGEVTGQDKALYRLLNRALVAWLQSPDASRAGGHASKPPVSVCLYQPGENRFVVISGPGAGVRAVFLVTSDHRVRRVRAWPEGLTGC